jgi:hypothetical protein
MKGNEAKWKTIIKYFAESDKSKVGTSFKNYREMCAIIGLDVCTGNSKTSQIKELERYFKLKKEGQSYLIEEKYEEAHQKVNKYKTTYGNDLRLILLNLMVEHRKENIKKKKGSQVSMNITIAQLFEQSNMVNKNYNAGYRNKQALANQVNMSKSAVSDFYIHIYPKLKSLLITCLDSLVNEMYIFYDYAYTILYINQRGEQKTDILAKPLEIEKIITFELEVARSMGYTDIRAIYIKDEYNLFTKEVCARLSKFYKYEVISYYKSVRITYNKYIEEKQKVLESLSEEERLIDLENTVDTKKKLNKNIVNNYKDQFSQNRKIVVGSTKPEDEKIERNHNLMDILVDTDALDITDKLINKNKKNGDTYVIEKKEYEVHEEEEED